MKKQVIVAFLMGLVLPLGWMYWKTGEEKLPPKPTEAASDPVTIAVVHDGAVQQMDLEEYVAAVVLAEMPGSFHEEALKAQAVVARTYGVKRSSGGGKHEGAAVCTQSSCCQGYRPVEQYLAEGGQEAVVEKVRSAVEETKGLVLRYEGALIDATYFSCSGGSTEAAVEVWGSDVPYLQAVDSPGEEDAVHFTDQVQFSTDEFATLTGCTGAPESWQGQVQYTQGGGVDTMELGGQLFTGRQLRELLGLKSTDFSLKINGETVTIITHGFGHRVGMSQYGAQAMAEQGKTYREILQYYYQGTELGT